MVRIVWTAEALRWLFEIHSHITSESPAATRVVSGIIQRVEQLASFPKMGSRLDLPGAEGLRMILYDHYRIVYLSGEDGVEIIGVYHGALDSAQRLGAAQPGGSGLDTIHDKPE